MKVKGNSLAGQSVLDVDTHKRADEVFRFFADVVPVGRVELKLPWKKGELYRLICWRATFEDLSKEVCIIFIVERWVATEQDVWDHSYTPDVHGFTIRFLGQNLRCDVARCSAGRGHDAGLLHLGETEVADHDLAVRVRAATILIRWDRAGGWLSRLEDLYLIYNTLQNTKSLL